MVSNNRLPNIPGKQRPTFGQAVINNLNDVNFQFEFPKFGQLPGPAASPSNTATTSGRSSGSPLSTRSPMDQVSPMDRSNRQGSTGSTPPSHLDAQTKEDLAKFSGIFSPPLTNNNVASAGRGSTDSHNSSSSSPSASSNSNGGPSSSCGTSPEPSNQFAMGPKGEGLATIGEENQHSFANTNQGKKRPWRLPPPPAPVIRTEVGLNTFGRWLRLPVIYSSRNIC